MSHRYESVTFCLSIAVLTLAGCTYYKTPGRGASMAAFRLREQTVTTTGDTDWPGDKGDIDIRIEESKPLATFPANVVTVRVQEPGYKSFSAEGIGRGKYSVVTVRDVEKKEDFERLAKLPYLDQIAPLSRLLLPEYLNSDSDLREAAARLQADMLLIYTFDTTFLNTDTSSTISIVSLGLAPTVNLRVITTVSAIVIDTRSGYIYGTVEETARKETTTSVFSTVEACDQFRRDTETDAWNQFLAEFESLWPSIVEKHRK